MAPEHRQRPLPGSATGPAPGSEPGSGAVRRRRLGLFGGSFDPVHVGHLHAARCAQRAFALDRVIFVPAARPPHKPGRKLAAGAERLAMLELALADQPSWSSSSIELERKGPSYTIDTVRDLRRVVGETPEAELYLILGSDNLPGLPQWSRVEELIEEVQPVVVYRHGDVPGLPPELARALSSAVCAKLEAGFLNLAPVRASSTELRERLGRGELALEAAVVARLPAAVHDYIVERGLYRSPE